ncbi:MAG: MBL fold metallo-hydrolase [Bacteroidales bacterium]|nr:MBL fold metallo-hydrolase [Bacteroidales bacterium]
MIRFMSLSSGSCGNCYFIGTEDAGILIDAGVSLRRLKKGLEEAGLSMNSFSSILVTHDHADHIRHLGSYCKKLLRPVYTTDVLRRALSTHTFTRDYFPDFAKTLETGQWNEIDGFRVRYFVVPHDATQTVGYAIIIGSYKIVIMTDVGRVTDEAIAFARQADTVIVESNYDIDMLMGGSYPADLKVRISDGTGHLSNDDCAGAILRFLHPELRHIFLCHLSENNNTPKLAYDCSAAVLEQACADWPRTPALSCLPRTYPSKLFILSE